MTIASPAPILTADGITAPSYPEILDFFQAQYRLIYGADVYLGNDSQDGQFLAVIAKAQHDSNGVAIAVYASFSPATAQRNGLASIVKTNGITKKVATPSTVDLVILGVVGRTIINGVVEDSAKNRWNLPASVTIPDAGTITVTATAQIAGAVAALPNTVNRIITPQLGWQSANNPAAAVLGQPVEVDAALRRRQSVSVAPRATTALTATVGAVAELPGVTRYTGYENPTDAPDANGRPRKSIAIIVEGGDSTEIAQAIANYKTQGALAYGTTVVTVPDIYGYPIDIGFFIVIEKRVTAVINLTSLTGYTDDIGLQIKQSLAAHVNALPIGGKVVWSKLFQPANLNGASASQAFEIDSLMIAAYPDNPANADILVGFDEAASLDVADITLIVA